MDQVKCSCPACHDHHPAPALLDDVQADVQGDMLSYQVTGVPGRPAHAEMSLVLRVRHPGGGYALRLQVTGGADGGYSFVIDERPGEPGASLGACLSP